MGAVVLRSGTTRLARHTDRTASVKPITVTLVPKTSIHMITRITERIMRPMLLGSEVPHGLEIVAAERLEGDEGPGVGDAGQGGHAVGDHIGQFVVAAD